MHHVAVVVGTRPEVIKMAPVVRALRARPDRFATTLVSTTQHRELLRQALDAVGLEPDVDLDLMRPDQAPAEFAARCLSGMHAFLTADRPDAVLVQGDTTTVAAASLAAAYSRVLVGHVEAGLRSHDRDEPFPEELNRRLTAVLASLHFAPTVGARRHLLAEGVAPEDVVVTGNTIVDALRSISVDGPFETPVLRALPLDRGRLVLATVHRRENHGSRLAGLCRALREIAATHRDVTLVLPVHPNPHVRDAVTSALAGADRVHVVPALPYGDTLRLLARAHLVLTDSGGVQEEAPSFRVPVLVLRDVTERPELIESGGGRLVGTSPARVVREAARLLDDESARERMRVTENPFGDGRAAGRIVDALDARLSARVAASGSATLERTPTRAASRATAPERAAAR